MQEVHPVDWLSMQVRQPSAQLTQRLSTPRTLPEGQESMHLPSKMTWPAGQAVQLSAEVVHRRQLLEQGSHARPGAPKNPSGQEATQRFWWKKEEGVQAVQMMFGSSAGWEPEPEPDPGPEPGMDPDPDPERDPEMDPDPEMEAEPESEEPEASSRPAPLPWS